MKLFKNKWFLFMLVLSIVIGGSYGIGSYFVHYALSPVSSSDERNVKDEVVVLSSDAQLIEENRVKEEQKGMKFEQSLKSVKIKGADQDILLSGKYLEKNNHQWAIMIHGYKSSHKNMLSYGVEYAKRGYNVLLPDNRAHGESQGEYVGMGWLDKDDITKWVEWIVDRDPQAEIIMHGVSMGGATTMMVSGKNLEHVIGYVEDCGYTSVWDIFDSELDKRFHLPSFPILDISRLVANLKAGYDFKTASSIEQVKKCQKPMLFIHGGKDDFVPTQMVYEVYQAAKCPKELYVVEPAGHGESKNYNPTQYWQTVFHFIDEKIQGEND